jgi:ElaB/YqjD/DUF883 family membrane-anchored ribosome-binding protein
MDATHELPEQSSDEMRQEIDCTRSALAEKMEALEHSVMGTVQNAQETVDDSIQMARDTVATVRRTFDIKHHVEQYPWVAVGGSCVAGLALGALFQRFWRPSRPTPERLAGSQTALSGGPPFRTEQRDNSSFATTTAPPPRSPATPPSRPGFFDRFQEEIDQVKGMAIGYVLGLVRDEIKDSVPQLASQINDVMNSITTKLGSVPAQPQST